MIVTAALAWWNERPEDLAACVAGMANVADRVVALDGSYRRYPEATIRSATEQRVVIQETAQAVGLECLVLQPGRLWAGQVEKRSYLLAIAALDSDWVAVVDADYVIQTDRQAVRSELETISQDVVMVTFRTPVDPSRPMSEQAASSWHVGESQGDRSYPHLFRALPGLRVERFHWWYSAIKDEKRVWISSNVGQVEHVGLQTPYLIEHRTLYRTNEQISASRKFIDDRWMVSNLTNQEDDVPGLPEPRF